jgi:hypothetical protein
VENFWKNYIRPIPDSLNRYGKYSRKTDKHLASRPVDRGAKNYPGKPGVNVRGFSDRFVRVSNSGTAVDRYANGKEIDRTEKKGGFSGISSRKCSRQELLKGKMRNLAHMAIKVDLDVVFRK